MTRDELLRILEFMEKAEDLVASRTALASNDARWNIISYCIRRHLEGRLLTTTSITAAAEVPYGTALRRIGELVEEGLLLKRPRSRTGKSFSVHPTAKLITEFEAFAIQLKSLVGSTFGFNAGDAQMKDFYFGGSYMAGRILPYPSVMRRGIGYERPLRILSHSDPTFKTLSDFSAHLNELCGGNLEILTLPLDGLREEIIRNGAKKTTEYDIVAFDIPWIGELVKRGIILPLQKIIKKERYSHFDFHNAAWRGTSYKGEQYGLPIQPTPELLFYRTDLFADAGISPPITTDDLLLAAKTLHRSYPGLAGIVMNYGRGTPVAHTFIQTMASFGRPVIQLTPLDEDFDVTSIKGDNFRPALLSDAARKTAEYLIELKAYAHRDSMECDWDRRIRIFAEGGAAMTYGWSIRAAYFELDETAAAHGKADFVTHPHAPGGRPVSPMGGFSIGIPSNLADERISRAWRMIEYLTRPELMKLYVQNGNLVSPRFSTSADPEVQALSPIIGKVDAMERRGELKLWPRPPIPEFTDIVGVLGRHVHDMLDGTMSIDQALSTAQNDVDRIMRENGRY